LPPGIVVGRVVEDLNLQVSIVTTQSTREALDATRQLRGASASRNRYRADGNRLGTGIRTGGGSAQQLPALDEDPHFRRFGQ
jgi:hypothetical protein